jgi:hypothetical protein
MRGMIHEYDSRNDKGIIRSEDGRLFTYYDDLDRFEVGDQVDFELKGGKVLSVEMFHAVEVFRDIYRCPTCRRYVLAHETIVIEADGEWDSYINRYCKICGKFIPEFSGRLSDAFSEYKAGKMSTEEARDFEAALVDRSRISDLLNRKYETH